MKLALAPPDDWYVSAFIVPALKLPAVGVPKLRRESHRLRPSKIEIWKVTWPQRLSNHWQRMRSLLKHAQVWMEFFLRGCALLSIFSFFAS